jgi:hypothetical protein
MNLFKLFKKKKYIKLKKNLKIFNEWSAEEEPGEMQAIIIILDLLFLLIKESRRTRVSFEALKGT